MASLTPAIKRISFVTKQSPVYQATPNTISGNPRELFSYALRIAYKDGDDWLVKADEDNSLTTNRHIRAAHDAIGGSRFWNAGVGCSTETIDGVRWVRYPG